MFGTTLSLFPAPAENPLSEGGSWGQTTPQRPPMRKVVGAATDSSHGDPNYSHWTQNLFFAGTNGIAEAFACTAGGQLGAALETWRVALWSTVGINVAGYLVYYGGGIGKGYAIRRYNGGIGNFTDIGGAGGGYPEKLGIRINGSQIEAWGFNSGVWTLAATVTDNAYRGYFYAGISIEDPTAGGLSMPCFGALIPNRTQFYRYKKAMPVVTA